MSRILHRVANANMPIAVGGRGVELVDADGKVYIDASGGAAVSCLGHGHPDVIAALHRQLDALAYAHTAFFTTEVAERLADRLIEDAPPGLSHVYLVGGGSEAIEAALKLARQYFVETGEPRRRRIIARRQSYHGNTLGALATGGNEWRRSAISAAAGRDPPYRSVFRLSPSIRRRIRRGLCRARGAGAGRRDSRTRAGRSHGVRRRDGRRRDFGRRAAGG
jgi:adenosylmethionine-8-amino-7-oxononanoate aminotransferase